MIPVILAALKILIWFYLIEYCVYRFVFFPFFWNSDRGESDWKWKTCLKQSAARGRRRRAVEVYEVSGFDTCYDSQPVQSRDSHEFTPEPTVQPTSSPSVVNTNDGRPAHPTDHVTMTSSSPPRPDVEIWRPTPSGRGATPASQMTANLDANIGAARWCMCRLSPEAPRCLPPPTADTRAIEPIETEHAQCNLPACQPSSPLDDHNNDWT